MIARCLLILAGLSVVGMFGAFLLYISALSLVTSIAIGLGVLGTLVLGYWAGSCVSSSPDEPSESRNQRANVSVINAREDVRLFREKSLGVPVPFTRRKV